MYLIVMDIEKEERVRVLQFLGITYFQRTYIHDDISNNTQVPI